MPTSGELRIFTQPIEEYSGLNISKTKLNKFREFIFATAIYLFEISTVKINDCEIYLKINNINNEEDFPKDQRTLYASVHMDDSYNNAYMNIYRHTYDAYEKGDYAKIVHVLCHEIMHIHLQRLENLGMQRCVREDEILEENERVAEELSIYLRELFDTENFVKDFFKPKTKKRGK